MCRKWNNLKIESAQVTILVGYKNYNVHSKLASFCEDLINFSKQKRLEVWNTVN